MIFQNSYSLLRSIQRSKVTRSLNSYCTKISMTSS
nr:MAG TPA: hypothetical protein [Bacteriophage sp.]DAH37766.1 MAG TPA: hypothetical protein [Caudoviricetes sp.]